MTFIFIFVFCGQANAEMKTTSNSHSGLNQFDSDFTFPKFESIVILGTYVTIDSRAKEIVATKVRNQTLKFEKELIERLTSELQTSAENEIPASMDLPLSKDITASSLVIRPSIIGLDIGPNIDYLFDRPDDIVISVEVFDTSNASVVARAQASHQIKKRDVYYRYKREIAKNYKIREEKLLALSNEVAVSLAKMLKVMFKDIEKAQ